jgi:fatty-acyl-CoA synthase
MNTGGMPVPPELVRRVERELGVPLLIGYGHTEACGLVLHTAPTDAPSDRAETLGRALPQIELRIADPRTGATVPPGVVGEICVRGYTAMTGCLDMSEATAQAIDGEGWLHTGDLGSMDERGYCRIAGRLKDMIIRGGENIYPREIEEVLEQHPAVAAAAVIGVPDRRCGEQVAACVELVAGQSAGESELMTFCRIQLAPYKVPLRWIFLDTLPRTPVGKIQKFAIRDMLRSEMLVEE